MKNSHLTLIIVALCALISLSAEAQQRRRSSSKSKRTTTAQITPLQAFIGATGELNNIWRITYVETPNEAIEMITTSLNLALTSLGEKRELRDLVAKTGEAYLDALSLRASRLKAEELFQDKELVSESIYRMERLANLRALKEKFYREYDDPVARGNNQAIWKLNEIEFERDFSAEAIARREGNRRLKLSAVKESMENMRKAADKVLSKYGIRERYLLDEGQAENAAFEVAKRRRLEVVRKSLRSIRD